MLWFSRIFFGIWCLLFLLFAYWQLNDPDEPWLWISVYGGAAFLSAMAASGRFLMPVLLSFVVLCFFGFVYLYPSSVSDWIQQEWQQQDLSMKTVEMEEARESFGLLVVGIIMLTAAFFGWRQRIRTESGRPVQG